MLAVVGISRRDAREEILIAFAGKQIAGWPTSNESNFPMLLDEGTQRVLIIFRRPATLGIFSKTDGSSVIKVRP